MKYGYKASAKQFAPRPLLDFSAGAQEKEFDSVVGRGGAREDDRGQSVVRPRLCAGSRKRGIGRRARFRRRIRSASTIRGRCNVGVAALPLEMAASRWLVSDDPDEMVEMIAAYVDYGFTHLVFHAPGPDPMRFLDQFSSRALPRLRARFGERAGEGAYVGRIRVV